MNSDSCFKCDDCMDAGIVIRKAFGTVIVYKCKCGALDQEVIVKTKNSGAMYMDNSTITVNPFIAMTPEEDAEKEIDVELEI